MGCWYTKHIHKRQSNVFKVMNVDEHGEIVSPGHLELTETEVVLYQKGKTSTRWPLAYIRRYGFESELFSFECGRRCPTGPGIYAFQCRHAELVFNLLQERIAVQRISQDDNLGGVTTSTSGNHEIFPMPVATSGPAVPIRPMLTDATYGRSRIVPRMNSVSSNGPTSPILSPEMSNEHNNNKRASISIIEHSYTNTILPLSELGDQQQQHYMNVDTPAPLSPSPSASSDTYSHELINNSHLYMNITPGDLSPSQLISKQSIESNTSPNELLTLVNLPLIATSTDDDKEQPPIHCYANLESEELDSLRNLSASTTREVVYAVLDLEAATTKDDTNNEQLTEIETSLSMDNVAVTAAVAATTTTTTTPPDSPKKLTKGYTIIDFNKTEAVSQIIAKPKVDCEGSRKTRHNSTICELGNNSCGGQNQILSMSQQHTRHSSSLSD